MISFIKSIIKILIEFHSKKFKIIDDAVKKQPMFLNFLVTTFDWCSWITCKLLFDLRIFLFLCLVSFIVPSLWFVELTESTFVIFEKGFSKESCYLMFKALPLILQILLLFYLILFEIIFFNMFLCQLDSIKSIMVEKYNDPLIISKRGYNSIYKSLIRTCGIVSCFGISAPLFKESYETYSQNETRLKIAEIQMNAINQHNKRLSEMQSSNSNLPKFQPIPDILKQEISTQAKASISWHEFFRIKLGIKQSTK